MEISLAVAADYASVDSKDKLNILGIFQEISPAAFPLILAQVYLVAVYIFPADELDRSFPTRIEWVTPRLDRTLIWEGALGFPADRIRYRDRPGVFNQANALMGMPIEMHGTHQFVITVEDGPRREVPIYVNRPG